MGSAERRVFDIENSCAWGALLGRLSLSRPGRSGRREAMEAHMIAALIGWTQAAMYPFGRESL